MDSMNVRRVKTMRSGVASRSGIPHPFGMRIESIHLALMKETACIQYLLIGSGIQRSGSDSGIPRTITVNRRNSFSLLSNYVTLRPKAGAYQRARWPMRRFLCDGLTFTITAVLVTGIAFGQ